MILCIAPHGLDHKKLLGLEEAMYVMKLHEFTGEVSTGHGDAYATVFHECISLPVTSKQLATLFFDEAKQIRPFPITRQLSDLSAKDIDDAVLHMTMRNYIGQSAILLEGD